MNVGRNVKYTSPQILADFLELIDNVVREPVLRNIKNSSVYSLIVDDSTDVSILKQLVLYGHRVVDEEMKTTI